jgi:hypothetical protein
MRNKAAHINQVPPDKGHYIAGFVDGEGSFYVSARVRKDYPSKWKFGLHFNVSNNDLAVLQICKRCLGCGAIRESRPGFYTLEVQDRSILKRFVIPFFRRYGFLSNKKRAEFRIFQEALIALEEGVRTKSQLEHFLHLRSKLNAFRQTRVVNTDEVVYQTFVFSGESSETIR